jgi:hypothetical protein
MSTLSFKISKARNLFEIKSLCIHLLWCSFSYQQSLPYFCSYQTVVKMTFYIRDSWLLSSVYEDIINIRLCGEKCKCFFDFCDVRNCTFDNQISECGKVYYSNPILIATFTWTPQLLGWKYFHSIHLHLNFLQQMFKWRLGNWPDTCFSSLVSLYNYV